MAGSRRERSERRALLLLLGHVVAEDHEVVTLFAGSEADPGAIEAALEWVAAERPGVGIQVIDGGQPLYPYLIGAE
jgi:dihydroxyacetone kinase-like predicted kinase